MTLNDLLKQFRVMFDCIALFDSSSGNIIESDAARPTLSATKCSSGTLVYMR